MTAPRDRRIRVATYNVHACVGSDGRHDPDRVASVISELDADIVALQEFTYPAEVALETREPVVLKSLDGYQCALGPTRRDHIRCFGNALLTRSPIAGVHRIDLSMERWEPRGALAATLDIGGTQLHVLAAHLGLRIRERRFQVRQILDYLDSVMHPGHAGGPESDGPPPPGLVLVLGDFNDWLPGRSVADLLDRRLGRPPRPRSFPVGRPLFALDRIWIHPLEALTTLATHRSALARRASDHLPVVAEIDLGSRFRST